MKIGDGDNGFTLMAVFFIFVPLLLLSFIYVSNVIPILDLQTAVGEEDTFVYEVEDGWAQHGVLTGTMNDADGLVYPDTSSDGSWIGRIQDISGDRSGTLNVVSDARDGRGQFIIRLWEEFEPDDDSDTVQIEDQSSFNNYDGSTEFSFDHSSLGSNRHLLLFVGADDQDVDVEATYGENSLETLNVVGSNNRESHILYLETPERGDNTLTVSQSAGFDSTVEAFSFSGVSGGEWLRDISSDSGRSSEFSNSVFVDGDQQLIVDSVVSERSFSPVGDQVQLYNRGLSDTGGTERFAGSRFRTDDSGEVSMGWVQDDNNDRRWIHQVVSLNNADSTEDVEPDRVESELIRTGSWDRDYDFSDYDFMEVVIELDEDAGTENERPHVSSFSFELEVDDDSKSGLDSDDLPIIVYFLWAYGILMFMIGIYKTIKFMREDDF